MFSEYLDRHPMEGLLLSPVPPLYPPTADQAAWSSLAKEDREQLRELARQYRDQPYPPRPATAFLAFSREGSRQADEQPYFLRRRKLCAAALSCCLEKNAADLDRVIDGIWCLCEETSWVISAHNVNPIPGAPGPRAFPLPDPDQPYIDLFSAQTGMILALTAHLLGDALDGVTPMLTARVRREIRLRILEPFMTTDDFWWMGVQRADLNNWTPWILSNILVCACLTPMTHQRLAALLDRAFRMLDRWLAVMPEDGGCDEGAGYWNMAGGALLDCLEIAERITGGRMAFWQEEKIRRILSFPRKAEIGGGWFVNFADCDARPFLSGERLQLAGERISDPALTALGCRVRGSLDDQLRDVPHFTRLLSMLFHPASAVPPAEQPADEWLPDLQLRLVRRSGMVLCCKGGHNGENHNHNDVGSFMLYADGEPCIVDAGNMVYTAQTFSDQRYTLWNVRSAYHNLPMIGGREQLPGSRYRARAARLPDGLLLELAAAYDPAAGIRSLRRELRLTDEGLFLRDQITLDAPQPAVWVFVLRQAPRFLADHAILSGLIRLDYPAGLTPAAEEIPVADPRMARSFPGSLWRVTLTAEPARRFDTLITAARRA